MFSGVLGGIKWEQTLAINESKNVEIFLQLSSILLNVEQKNLGAFCVYHRIFLVVLSWTLNRFLADDLARHIRSELNQLI